MDEKSRLHSMVGITSDLSVLFRNLGLAVLIGMLLVSPDTLRSGLLNLGVKKLDVMGAEVDLGTADTVSTLNLGLTDSVAGLKEVQNFNDPRGLKNAQAKIQNITKVLESLQQQAQGRDDTIKVNLATRQAVSTGTPAQSAKTPGWIFAGQVDEQQASWSGEGTKNVPATLPAKPAIGATFTVTGSAYLRGDGPSGNHVGGKVIGVLPLGTQARVIDQPQYSHALAGGNFMWLKVQPL